MRNLANEAANIERRSPFNEIPDRRGAWRRLSGMTVLQKAGPRQYPWARLRLARIDERTKPLCVV